MGKVLDDGRKFMSREEWEASLSPVVAFGEWLIREGEFWQFDSVELGFISTTHEARDRLREEMVD